MNTRRIIAAAAAAVTVAAGAYARWAVKPVRIAFKAGEEVAVQ